jgi:CHAT domain-containing protein
MVLDGTELVVLSACETGLGEVKEGEGVYGLRRAFQMAGARTVISALWPVSDKVTAEMMGRLYDRGPETLPERMRKIQLEKIQDLRARGEADHPFTWGAFIALGDWR